jgi:molybdopterin-guanine dinucleotide biosynthesis protein A
MKPALQGLVLAGGRSSRMGTDKAAVRFAGRTLLGRAVTQLRGVVAHVYVSSRADQEGSDIRAPYTVIADQATGIGPAAGLLAAHELFPDVAWLVLAVDMPLVTSLELTQLVRARDASAAATAWRSPADGKPEPLCAIYEPATLAALALQVEQGGSSSLRRWLEGAAVKYLPAASSELLRSANTPAELDELSRWRTADITDGKVDGG